MAEVCKKLRSLSLVTAKISMYKDLEKSNKINFSSRNHFYNILSQMLQAVFKLQLEFFPGLDPTNQASGKLNIVFTRSQRLAVPESHVWTK